ncbi:MAG: argininosuccinate lyase [Candidatus Hecatellales archaeon]|nr:MAG: argininosuccinate lyase [Candidatus Hecatellales archaeon]
MSGEVGEGGIYRSRLGKPMEREAAQYLSSLLEDVEIFEEDIDGTEAHVIMLQEQGIITRSDAGKILRTLEELREEWRQGKIKLDPEKFEDVHELIEAYVVGRLGLQIGGKMHTGRSRNDQVALDIRLRLRRRILNLWGEVLRLAEALRLKASEEKKTLMVLYTHTQHAQIGFLSHYLISYAEHLLRDAERLEACYRHVNLSPLGASAIGGSTLPLDRLKVAELLGFEGLVENSIDAVSSRDFLLEAACQAAILMVHLSRMAEDLVLWSSSEFGYVELPDEFASPSSIMPQKKNPCVLELVRSRAGRVCGLLAGLLASIKSVPTGYSRDLQDVKPPLWEIFNLTESTVKIFSSLVEGLKFNRERLGENALKSYASALDLAEALIKEAGLSLREAHRVVGEMVRLCLAKGLTLQEAGLPLLEKASEKTLGRKVSLSLKTFREAVNPASSPMRRATLGSPSPRETLRMLKRLRDEIRSSERMLRLKLRNLEKAERKLRNKVYKLIS